MSTVTDYSFSASASEPYTPSPPVFSITNSPPLDYACPHYGTCPARICTGQGTIRCEGHPTRSVGDDHPERVVQYFMSGNEEDKNVPMESGQENEWWNEMVQEVDEGITEAQPTPRVQYIEDIHATIGSGVAIFGPPTADVDRQNDTQQPEVEEGYFRNWERFRITPVPQVSQAMYHVYPALQSYTPVLDKEEPSPSSSPLSRLRGERQPIFSTDTVRRNPFDDDLYEDPFTNHFAIKDIDSDIKPPLTNPFTDTFAVNANGQVAGKRSSVIASATTSLIPVARKMEFAPIRKETFEGFVEGSPSFTSPVVRSTPADLEKASTGPNPFCATVEEYVSPDEDAFKDASPGSDSEPPGIPVHSPAKRATLSIYNPKSSSNGQPQPRSEYARSSIEANPFNAPLPQIFKLRMPTNLKKKFQRVAKTDTKENDEPVPTPQSSRLRVRRCKPKSSQDYGEEESYDDWLDEGRLG
ncbi:hypothetical protein K504DRAFT_450294 [Pleomassaria siparia CBS 279.74]|uniref:Uncharacterized protein n=1 Tax=Pleomassaria siparia CBS 279.74 TaxID=1314801 RepID=A0A6G1KMS8_9PLEO|nr:hypothetical protein K504DRAFT_450294 [Pleomassaria siparia CBS 279.74]